MGERAPGPACIRMRVLDRRPAPLHGLPGRGSGRRRAGAPTTRRPRPRSAPWRLFGAAPSLLLFHGSLGLPLGAALQLLCGAGLALALAVIWAAVGGAARGGALAAAMGGLWLLLLSARNVGQGFLSGPWEALLLEAGWAAAWLAAAPGGPAAPAPPALLLLRWQLFKALLLDATAKLRAACAGGAAGALAACFLRVAAGAAAPGRASWLWAAAAPPQAQAAALGFVLAAQLPGSFLALSPFRGARLAGAALQLAAAAAGALTGAGGGAPALLFAALCLALADDAALGALCARGLLPRGGGGGGAAKAPAAAAGGAPKLAPISTGKGAARRDSLDELLASPRYHGAPRVSRCIRGCSTARARAAPGRRGPAIPPRHGRMPDVRHARARRHGARRAARARGGGVCGCRAC